MAEVRRTVVVKLDVDDSDAPLLHETIERMGDRESRWVEDYLHRIS